MLENREINSSDGDVRSRSLQLYSFLRELLQHQLAEASATDHTQELLWLHELPGSGVLYGVLDRNKSNGDADDIWIELRKPVYQFAPAAPPELALWLNADHLQNSSREYPELLAQTANPNFTPGGRHEAPLLYLKDHRSTIQPLWESWVEKEWYPWALRDRQDKQAEKLFAALFAIYQHHHKLGSSYETVIGFGHLHWQHTETRRIRQHVLRARVSVEFNSQSETLQVKPAASGLQLQIDPALRSLSPEWDFSQIEEELKVYDDLNTAGIIDSLLAKIARIFAANGQYISDSKPLSQAAEKPLLHLAPALLLRRRAPVTTFLQSIEHILSELLQSDELPVGIENLIGTLNAISSEDSKALGDPGDTNGSIYFPLAHNQKQLQVARLMQEHPVVLVNAPPGSGKTQTIANLVCHLLSGGKRILVTSNTNAALADLRERIPDAFRLLTAGYAGDNLAALNRLEDTVQAFVAQHDDWSSHDNRRAIDNLDQKYQALCQREQAIISSLNKAMQQQNQAAPLESETYSGTPEEILQRLTEDRNFYKWFSDIPPSSDDPPVSNADLVEFVLLMRQIPPEKEAILRKRTIDPAQLMTPEDFARYQEIEGMARNKNDEFFNNRYNVNHPILSKAPAELRDELLDALSKIIDTYHLLNQHVYSWVKKAALDILGGEVESWRNLAQDTNTHLEYIRGRIPAVADIRVSGLGEFSTKETKAHAIQLYEHMRSGGKVGSGPFRPRMLRDTSYITRDILIDGMPVDTEQKLRPLIVYLDIADRLETMTGMWSSHTELPKKAPVQIQFVEFENLFNTLIRALELDSLVYVYRTISVQIEGLLEPEWRDPEALQEMRTSLLAINLEENAQRPFALLTRILWAARPDEDGHPVLKSLLASIKKRDHSAYKRRFRRLERIIELQKQLERRTAILDRLAEKCPRLLQSILLSYEDPVWDERAPRLSLAWEWAYFYNVYKDSVIVADQAELEAELDGLQHEKEEIITRLGAERAILATFNNLTAATQTSLREWASAARFARKQGQATPSLHRKLLRDNGNAATTAIPAWFIPLNRLNEMLPLERDRMDVAIVDEANLIGLEGLLLPYLAKKIVVFGDNMQISVSDSRLIDRHFSEHLHTTHLASFPRSAMFAADSSFYDLMRIFVTGSVKLREHFRCHSEIIDFCNQLSYAADPLIPLRQPNALAILPSFRHTLVPDGRLREAEAKSINDREIDALTDTISQCCREEQYLGKTIAVISLNGVRQAQELQRRILATLGSGIFKERQLICGTPDDCYGMERDLVFISLGIANNHHYHPLTGPISQRMFNTVITMAREQVWVFSSVEEEALDERCLRNRLLQYLKHPASHFTEKSNLRPLELHNAVIESMETRIELPRLFSNWFQVDIFHAVSTAGYKVIPNALIGYYRADLLLESPGGCLIIECDPENGNQPKCLEKSAIEKRRLQKLGWNFWTISRSEFEQSDGEAMHSLWHLLELLSISPLRSATAAAALPDAASSSATPMDHLASGYQENKSNGSISSGQNGHSHNGSGEHSEATPFKPQFSAQQLQEAIVRSLAESPDLSCPKDELPARVCLLLDIRPDDLAMNRLKQYVFHAIMLLEEEGLVAAFEADTQRIRLVSPDNSSENSAEQGVHP